MVPGSARRYRRRQRRRRRRALVLAAVLIVAAAAFAEIRGHGQHSPSTLPAQAPSPAGSSAPPAAAGALTTAGEGVAWADFHGIALPVSAHAGPHHTRDGLAWGFHDTPRGALLAAVNIGVRTAALWGPATYAPTINHQVTGPAKDALLKADTSDYTALRAAAHVQAGQPAGRAYAAEAAYRFTTWTPGRAVVDIVTEGPRANGTTVLAATRIEVIWRGGDWRVLAPPGGDWGNAATRVASLTGYTTFPAER
ncbi:MAG: hypothetical protein ACRDPY_04220 [Streptosporangiaceae bacterium]